MPPPFNNWTERRLRLTQKKLSKRAEREQRRLDRRRAAGENPKNDSFAPRAEHLVERIER